VAESGDRADGVLASLSDEDLARALGLTTVDGDVSVGSLLLFGRVGTFGCADSNRCSNSR
jgi:hypothetical protein